MRLRISPAPVVSQLVARAQRVAAVDAGHVRGAAKASAKQNRWNSGRLQLRIQLAS
jgi:hypothetical protein